MKNKFNSFMDTSMKRMKEEIYYAAELEIKSI